MTPQNMIKGRPPQTIQVELDALLIFFVYENSCCKTLPNQFPICCIVRVNFCGIIQRRENTNSVFTLQCCEKNVIAELRIFRQHRAMAVCAKNIFVADTFHLIFTVIMNIHLKTPTDRSSPCHLPRCLSVYRRVYRTAAAQWDLLCRRQPACPRP